jgi:hypothetical protein
MKIQELPQPLQTWLQKSYLTQTPDKSCVLFLDNTSLPIVSDISYLSQIYPIALELYPDITSLYLTSSSIQDFIKSGKVQLYSVEVIK